MRSRTYRIPVDGQWLVYTQEDMDAWKKTDPSKAEMLSERMRLYETNKLAYFLPHGQGQAFLNDRDNDVVILLAPQQVGKALAVSEEVYTETGVKKIGDVVKGDYILGGDGKPYRVNGVFPQGTQKLYRVYFSKGEVSCLCTLDHLWKYLPLARAYKRKVDRKHKNTTHEKWQVLSLGEILKRNPAMDGRRLCGYIPACSPAVFLPKLHFIHPYVLGVFLGDGGLTNSVSFTSTDPEIISRVSSLLSGSKLTKRDETTYRVIFPKKRDSLGRMMKSNPVKNEFVRLGLMGKHSFEKFIPGEYLFDSVENRIELLRGVMDTDGYVSAKCTMEYSTTSPHLARDVAWLVRSLGGKVLVKQRDSFYRKDSERRKTRPSYRVIVKMSDINPFYLSRKATCFYPIQRRKELAVWNVKEAGYGECVCLSVGSPDGTFLTTDFIVTHNTTLGAIFTALRTIPCDKNWEIFTQHGIQWHPWEGPKEWIISSWSWDNVEIVWNRYREFLPLEELREYSPDWHRHQKNICFGDGKPKHVQLKCGTKFYFLCDTQQDFHWEGRQADGHHADEQRQEVKFDAYTARTLTRGFCQCCMTLTGFKIEGRPDTGMGGWIKGKLWDGLDTKGHAVGRYQIKIPDVPDAIMSAEKKKFWHVKWVENPRKLKDQRALNEAQARYWGGWQPGGGLVIYDWQPEVHLIRRFDIPRDWTRYRVIDHGQDPCAALWFAVSPQGNAFIYREYYEYALSIGKNAEKLVEASGNERRQISEWQDGDGAVWPIYEEVETQENYMSSIMDIRSFGFPTTGGLKIGTLYQHFGLNVRPSVGTHREKLIPLVRQWFAVDKTKSHFETGKKGAPRIYVFADLVNFRQEIEGWVLETTPGGKEKASGKREHEMSCLCFWAAESPGYYGSVKNQSDAKKYSVDSEGTLCVRSARSCPNYGRITTGY